MAYKYSYNGLLSTMNLQAGFRTDFRRDQKEDRNPHGFSQGMKGRGAVIVVDSGVRRRVLTLNPKP